MIIGCQPVSGCHWGSVFPAVGRSWGLHSAYLAYPACWIGMHKLQMPIIGLRLLYIVTVWTKCQTCAVKTLWYGPNWVISCYLELQTWALWGRPKVSSCLDPFSLLCGYPSSSCFFPKGWSRHACWECWEWQYLPGKCCWGPEWHHHTLRKTDRQITDYITAQKRKMYFLRGN